MNNDRRKSIQKTRLGLESLKTRIEEAIDKIKEDFLEDLDDLQNAIDQDRTDEEEYYENMPENMQQSERYALAEEAASRLQEAYDKVGEVRDALDGLTLDGLEEALDLLDDAAQ